ncbi:MAG: hypothetical protein ACRC91_22750, partial [Aeromonas sp.]
MLPQHPVPHPCLRNPEHEWSRYQPTIRNIRSWLSGCHARTYLSGNREMTQSLFELEQKTDFVRRHIGPGEE